MLRNPLPPSSLGAPCFQALRYSLELKGINISGECWCRCHSSPLTLAGTDIRVTHTVNPGRFDSQVKKVFREKDACCVPIYFLSGGRFDVICRPIHADLVSQALESISKEEKADKE